MHNGSRQTVTFDAAGESEQILIHDVQGAPLFIRRDRDEYVVAYNATGEPTEGNQYLRSTDLADLLDTLARRGYRVSSDYQHTPHPATSPTGPTITAVRIYQHDGEWCYAADTIDGYDHSDTIDVEHDATPDEAEREVRTALKIDAAVSVECLTGPKAQ